MTIIRAQIEHLDHLIPLFDSYRVFYKQDSNLLAEKHFLFKRLKNKDSEIFIAYLENVAVGFTQLFPLFSSVSMEAMCLLNDLFVDANFRGHGIGEALINEAKNYCKKNNLKGLAIQTASNNPAQHLYQRLGFKKDADLHFFWTNK
ncbi:GNAT family N-acetyltransferase [Formosa maritima]|uniref:GNAT family N-acetyltransferase n=1 Tax=Formosa maritima TaxID=2592046 RepID=A0A5D0GE23_9FLAO|nr:GNAT family N-acetyltransferase [Formosa maritima]TYA57238.1 GNAT family N-acetyltransferase [Formosa maritima]